MKYAVTGSQVKSTNMRVGHLNQELQLKRLVIQRDLDEKREKRLEQEEKENESMWEYQFEHEPKEWEFELKKLKMASKRVAIPS